jgi:hypothetical protein
MAMMRQTVTAGIAVVCLGTLALLNATAPAPQGHRPVPPSAATVVTTFVQTALILRVLIVEGALASANRTVRRYCSLPSSVPELTPSLLQCDGLVILPDDRTLGTTLTREAGVLAAAGYAVASLQPPVLDTQATVSLALVAEDLVLCSTGLASLLRETAASVERLQPLRLQVVISSRGYWSRVCDFVTLLQRAEGCLVTLDRETGAQAILPGFAPGAPPLETVLALQ